MSIESLVQRAAAGDAAAFVELTRRFQQFAFGAALALLRDAALAEDAAQEAFLAAWTGLPRLQEPKAFPGWLRGIVRHHCLRLLRRRELATVPLDAAAALPSAEPAADRALERRQQLAQALQALGALPPQLREPATLYYLHDCSQQDIA